jgi:hypothetical protein
MSNSNFLAMIERFQAKETGPDEYFYKKLKIYLDKNPLRGNEEKKELDGIIKRALTVMGYSKYYGYIDVIVREFKDKI